jgi:hypothetical protein
MSRRRLLLQVSGLHRMDPQKLAQKMRTSPVFGKSNADLPRIWKIKCGPPPYLENQMRASPVFGKSNAGLPRIWKIKCGPPPYLENQMRASPVFGKSMREKASIIFCYDSIFFGFVFSLPEHM